MQTLVRIGVFVLVFGVLERVPGLRLRALPFLRRAFATDAAHLAAQVVLAAASLAGVAAATRALAALGMPQLASLALPLWATAPLALVLLDFGHYAVHFALHRVGALWELHKVHHSSPDLDWLATFRSHFFEQALRHALAPLPLVIIGMPLDAAALASALFSVVAVLNHANLSLPLGRLEAVFVTPRLHRLHHVPASCENNLGGLLALWDRLRGTWCTAAVAPDVALGIPGEVGCYPDSWLRQQVEPLRRWRESRRAPELLRRATSS